MQKTTAQIASEIPSWKNYAVKVTEFSSCKVYDFADKSFLVVHDNGRIEVNSISF